MEKKEMKKYIPYGPYCYTVIGQTENGLKTKHCPFFQYVGLKVHMRRHKRIPYKETTALYKCLYCNTTTDEDFLLADSVKIFGVHENY